ncbi:MAG: hypothetical protein WBF17_19245 [Phycisphaerae bacterium]
MPVNLAQGDVFWYQPDDPREIEHRVVVCSDPDLDPSSIVVVPITTWDEGKDESCLVTPDEYGVLTHVSCLDYRYAEIFTAADLSSALASGSIRPCPAVSRRVLEKILAGALDTRFLNPRCLYILTAQNLLD